MNRKKILILSTILIVTFIFVGVSISQENQVKTLAPMSSKRLILGVTHGQTKRANISQIMKDGILQINEYFTWGQLEPKRGTYSFEELDKYFEEVKVNGGTMVMEIELTYTLCADPAMSDDDCINGWLPYDLMFDRETSSFDDAEFVSRLSDLVTTILRRYDPKVLTHVYVGNETDTYMRMVKESNGRDLFPSFERLIEAIQRRVRVLPQPRAKFGTIFTYLGRGYNWQKLPPDHYESHRKIARLVDVIGFTIYPTVPDLDEHGTMLEKTQRFLDNVRDIAGSTPIAITEIGHPAVPSPADTSPEQQAEFARFIVNYYRRYQSAFEYITWFSIYDNPNFKGEFFGGTGLLTINGVKRPAYNVWVRQEESSHTKKEIIWHMKGVELDVSLEEMKQMRRAGIAALTTEWGMEEDVAQARAFLDRANTAGLKVVMDGGFTEAAWGYDYDVGFSEDQLPVWQEALAKEWVSAFKDHPALFGWDISNEDGENFPNAAGSSLWPEKSSLTIEQLRIASKTVRAIDPNHPILLRMHYWDPSPNPFGPGNWFADGIADIVMLNLYSNYSEDRRMPNLPEMISEHGQRHIDGVRRIDSDAKIWIALAAFEAETYAGYFLKPTVSNLKRDIKAAKALLGVSGIGFLEWGPEKYAKPHWYLPRDGKELWEVVQEKIRR